jgi:hypothetical protein
MLSVASWNENVAKNGGGHRINKRRTKHEIENLVTIHMNCHVYVYKHKKY